MPKLSKFFKPASYFRYIPVPNCWANLRGLTYNPPGHFYSPLIDIETQPWDARGVEFDDIGSWEHIDLQSQALQAYHADLITHYSSIDFPAQETSDFRYYSKNGSFVFSDAYPLLNTSEGKTEAGHRSRFGVLVGRHVGYG